MVPLVVGAIAAGVAVTTSAIGRASSAGDRDKAEKLALEAFDEIQAVGAPPDLAREILREKFTSAGLYTPQIEQAIDAGISKVAKIKEDSKLREAEMGALRQFQERGKVGITAEERAALNKIRQSAARDAEARKQSLIQQFQARGMAGSGTELATQLSGAQASDQMAAEEADRIAAEANRRALESIGQSANLASQVRAEDLNINKTRAQAEDELQRFNVENQIARQSRNIERQNQASLRNLENEQRLREMNIDQINRERERQRQAEADVYGLKSQRARDLATAKLGKSNFYSGKAADTQGFWTGMGNTVSSGITGGYSTYAKGKQNDREMDLKEQELRAKYPNFKF